MAMAAMNVVSVMSRNDQMLSLLARSQDWRLFPASCSRPDAAVQHRARLPRTYCTVSAGGLGVSFNLRRCPEGVTSVLREKTPILGFNDQS